MIYLSKSLQKVVIFNWFKNKHALDAVSQLLNEKFPIPTVSNCCFDKNEDSFIKEMDEIKLKLDNSQFLTKQIKITIFINNDMRYHEIALDEIKVVGGVFEPINEPDTKKFEKEFVGSKDGIDFYKSTQKSRYSAIPDTEYLLLYKDKKQLGYITTKEDGVFLQLSPYIFKEYRGSNIATKIYKFLLDKGYLLQSEGVQSIGGMKIWQALMNDPNYKVEINHNGEYDKKIKNAWNNDKRTILRAYPKDFEWSKE